jgi:hypothetical protein
MKQKFDIRDLTLRFVLGGSAVAACYIMLQLIPSKAFAGIFAAFPAVMVAAVIMAGVFDSSRHAADVAFGATAGMIGCTVCVLLSTISMTYLGNWVLSLLIGTIAWFISSVFSIRIVQSIMKKS